jgi:hypothetical protein
VTDAIISTLIAEESRLENELRALPVFRRLEALRSSIQALRAVYETEAPTQAHNRETKPSFATPLVGDETGA